MSEYSTPVSTGTETDDERADDERADDERADDGAGAPNWAGAMAQIDAEIDELRALLARRRAADEAAAASRADGPGDGPDDAVA